MAKRHLAKTKGFFNDKVDLVQRHTVYYQHLVDQCHNYLDFVLALKSTYEGAEIENKQQLAVFEKAGTQWPHIKFSVVSY